MGWRGCVAVVLAFVASSGGALAQPATIGGSSAAIPPPADWTFDIGPGIIVGPWFEGSANYRVLPIPNLDLRYKRDKFFISARDGIGATLLDSDGFKLGPILRYRFPRNGGDGGYLFGMGNVPFTLEGGGFARYDLPYLGARVEVRRGLGGHNGLMLDAQLDGKLKLADTVFLSAGPRIAFTDATYNQAYFGVDSNQSVNSGYAQYYPGAGLRSYGVGASLAWRITDALSFVAFGSYSRLGDIAASSPIVTGPGGSRDQFLVGSALSYRFSW